MRRSRPSCRDRGTTSPPAPLRHAERGERRAKRGSDILATAFARGTPLHRNGEGPGVRLSPLDGGEMETGCPAVALEQCVFPVGEPPRREEDDALHRFGDRRASSGWLLAQPLPAPVIHDVVHL